MLDDGDGEQILLAPAPSKALSNALNLSGDSVAVDDDKATAASVAI